MKLLIDRTLILLFGVAGTYLSVPGGVQKAKEFKDPKTGSSIRIGELGNGIFGVGIFNEKKERVGWFGISKKDGTPGFVVKDPGKGWEVFLGLGKGARAGIWVRKGEKKKVFLGALGNGFNGLEIYGQEEKVCGFFRVSNDGKVGNFGFGEIDKDGHVRSGFEMGENQGGKAYWNIKSADGARVSIFTRKGVGSRFEIDGKKGGGSIIMAAGKESATIELQPMTGLPGIRLISNLKETFSGMKFFDFKGKERVRIGLEGNPPTSQKPNLILFDPNGKKTWSALPVKK